MNLRIIAISALLATPAYADSSIADTSNENNPASFTWTDPDVAATEDPDFLVQGEYGYEGETSAWGVQVVALGGGDFDAYLLEGGLPGAGWNRGNKRIKLSGKRQDEGIEFSNEDRTISADIQDGRIRAYRNNQLLAELSRIERESPTLGAEAPEGAVVLFDGSTADAWIGGRIENGLLPNTNITSKQEFSSYSLHLEFRTPYKPFARGQQRGNSGIYHQGLYETQVLDSFGLEGRENECGGVYSIAAPLVNSCLPPLTWQTYDIDFTAARVQESGEIIEPARITAKLNGILIHDAQELPHPTTASPAKIITADPGPIFIQHHKNPVYYRNIWIVPK